jgi:PAS domain S-box-containing protein
VLRIPQESLSVADLILFAELQSAKKELEQKSKQLELMTTLAIAATEPGDLGHLIRRCLEIIARSNSWSLAQFWSVTEEQQGLDCSEWYYASTLITDIRLASTDRRLTKGIDLPGRAWSNGFPMVLANLESSTGLTFTRKSPATKCGMQSAYAVPVKNGHRTVGVLEFFSSESIEFGDTDHLFYDRLGMYIGTLIAQRNAEFDLRQNDAINRIVLDHAYSAFVCINQAGVITDWTSRATALFGWEKEEVLGQTIHDTIIPERHRDAHLKGLVRYMVSKQGPVINKPVRAPAIHKDGREIPVELLIFPIDSFGLKRFGAFIVDCSKPAEDTQIVLE